VTGSPGSAGTEVSTRTSDYDYVLPGDLIAQWPAGVRDGSRLLVLDRRLGTIRHGRFADLLDHLAAGDVLVLNESRVLPARLLGRTPSGGRAEVLLVEPAADAGGRTWMALLRPGRAARSGTVVSLDGGWSAVVEGPQAEGLHRVRLEGEGALESFLEAHGRTPLPPYIKREDTPLDRERYQTVYARRPGSVAAPTAGLHFTGRTLERLAAAGVTVAPVVLHVGPGTFLPVRGEDLSGHDIHPESYEIPEETALGIGRAREAGGRVVCVGTTSVRAVEAAAREGGAGPCRPGAGRTRLFIHPPFDFRIADGILTNFHLPRSTLLMLVCAFAGREAVLRAYEEAVARGYRFYSYGDAMLVI